MLLTTWEDYLEDLCQQHTALQHGPSRRAFVVFGSEEAAPTTGSTIRSPYVRHASFDYSQGAENQRITQTELLFLATVKNGPIQHQIQLARVETQQLADEFVARIMADADNGILCVHGVTVKSFDVSPVELTDEKSVGWLLNLSRADDMEPDYHLTTETWLDL